MNAYAPQAYTILGVDAMQTEMAAPLHLAPVGDKAVDLDFAGGLLSADAGLVLLNAPDEPRGFTRALAAVRKEARDPRRVHFPWHDLRTQRVLHIAAGSEDANDANTLRHDPLFKRLLDRLPDTGPPLASHPTRSRCENPVSRTELYRLARVLVDPCITAYARPPQRIGLDCDETEEPVHGEQEQARYAGYDGGSGCLPLHRYEGLSGRLSTTIFQAKRCTGTQMLSVWKRLGKRRRHAWPDTLVILRGDRHCASPEVRQWLAAPAHLRSGTGWTSTAVLQTLARDVVEQATRASERAGGTITRFHATRSQAGPWSCSRRVVITVAVSDPGVHTRLVVTDMEEARTQVLSQHMYGARGQAENESKEHKRSLQADRMSCHRLEANQCRMFRHSVASV
jgi:hypothetical protein